MAVDTVLTIAEIRSVVSKWRQAGEKVAFVPTMGALHDGHLSLVLQARAEGARVVVSIFVNPMQFGPSEDFARYPRTLKEDVEKLQTVGADVVFAPAAAEIYPVAFQTSVINKKMSEGLCGKFRPGHFEGVLTVVLKLLNIVAPDMALFGKKDYQQWRLIERMAKDVELPIEIRGCDTIREKDGLAMSSRNRYMSAEEREESALIYKGLSAAKAAWERGERSLAKLTALFKDSIAQCPRMKIQYAEIVDRFSLEPAGVTVAEKNLVMIIAVLFGDVRLIDNLEF